MFSVSPSLVVTNQLVGAPLGTDVTIDCLIEAYPRPISFWVFHDPRTMLFPGSKHNLIITENGYKSHMKLTITSLSLKDYGSYKCMTKNSLGESEGSMRIYGKCLNFYNRLSPITNEIVLKSNIYLRYRILIYGYIQFKN